MPHQRRLWDRVSAPGFALAAGYVALVLASLALAKSIWDDVSYNGIHEPSYDWVPFYLLVMPWSLLFERIEYLDMTLDEAWIAWVAGIVVNTAAIYMIGSLMQPMWVQFVNWHKNRDH